MLKKILLSSTVIAVLNATDISDFINLKNCDQIIDKQVFKICYSYKYKGALAVWYELDENLINKNNIEKRPEFYSEKNIPTLNRKTWIKAEKYERFITSELKTVTVINLVDYSESTTQIGKNNLSVPNAFYKIIFNDNKNFKKCFKYENIEINPETDKLKDHQIDC